MAYWRLFYHVTWATLDHRPMIEPACQNSLHNMIAAECKKFGALVYAVGGTKSQIYLVAAIPPKISLSKFVGQVKGASSHFYSNNFSRKFRWHPKFGIVSFNDEHLDMVIEYVTNNDVNKTKIRFLEKCYVRQGECFLPFWRLHYHFVWTTRLREPIIDPQWEPLLYNAIRTKSEELDAEVYGIGGIEDHVHLAVSSPPKMALSTFIGDVKGFSSCWINDNVLFADEFYWQSKYGVVSFGRKILDNVVNYINHQKQHHEEKEIIAAWERTS